MSREAEARAAAQRLNAVIYNHPKVQYLRLTRREAEAIIAALQEES